MQGLALCQALVPEMRSKDRDCSGKRHDAHSVRLFLPPVRQPMVRDLRDDFFVRVLVCVLRHGSLRLFTALPPRPLEARGLSDAFDVYRGIMCEVECAVQYDMTIY